MCFTGNNYDIFICNYIFNYLFLNILVYFQNVWLFLYLGQSIWEDKVTAIKIRGSSTLTKTLHKGALMSGLMMLISIVLFSVTMVICNNAV